METILSVWYDQGYFSSHTIQLLECLLEIHHHKPQKNLSQSGAWKTLQVSFRSQSLHPFLMRGALKMKMMQLSWLWCCYQNLMWFLTQATDELEPDKCLLRLLDSGSGILLKNGVKLLIFQEDKSYHAANKINKHNQSTFKTKVSMHHLMS